MWLGCSESHREVPVVSTGSFSLDLALGISRLPKVCIPSFPYVYGSSLSGSSFLFTVIIHYIVSLAICNLFGNRKGLFTFSFSQQSNFL
jgi:hypothetical protein